MSLFPLIVWNIFSSLNAVISTNERKQIYGRSHGLEPGLYLILTDYSHHFHGYQITILSQTSFETIIFSTLQGVIH